MIIFCWTFPRTRSTALEKCFAQIISTMHEPFSASYYVHNTDFPSQKVPDTHETDFGKVVEKIRKMERRYGNVFIKELAYCVIRQREEFLRHLDFFQSCNHVFLLRDPKETIPSLYHQMKKVYGDDCPIENIEKAIGVEELFHLQKTLCPEDPFFIYSERLLDNNTSHYLKSICSRLGLPFSCEMLHWEKGALDDWQIWSRDGWHDKAMERTTFQKEKTDYPMNREIFYLIEKHSDYYTKHP
jgi:hypothetical protein